MEGDQKNWKLFENYISEEIPPCIKVVLGLCGFNTLISLSDITYSDITKIEECISENFSESITQLKCCYSEYYKSHIITHQNFKLLPGHAALLVILPQYIKEYRQAYQKKVSDLNGRYSLFLNELIQTAEENRFKSSNQASYSDTVRYFAMYIFLLCGRACYDMLQSNLPIPSTPTILRDIGKYKSRIIEGQIRAEELGTYLERMKVSKQIWLSEDATVITSKVTYDPHSNQLVDLVLPFDTQTGCPKAFTYLALNAELIKRHLVEAKSTYVYIVMAQPIEEKVPPFLLQMFGTNNRFETADVLKRWRHTETELNRYGIQILGWSSDGDPRLLSAMCHQIVREPENSIQFVQDTIHIATKLRNRLLKAKVMNMGSKYVSMEHLEALLKNVQKSVHGLSKSDVSPQDRQNFESFTKITDDRVLDALQKSIPGSEATVKFLQICRAVTSSYLDLEISPLERVSRMFQSIYFLRMWRNHISCSQYFRLKDHFITSNAYKCIEINGQSMLTLLNICRQNNTPDLFRLPIFSSQTCEQAFRLLRSMGTVNFTKINFSLYEILHMIGRVELQHHIAYFKLSEDAISFPKNHKRNQKIKIYELPSVNEIERVLNEAKQKAIDDGRSFGIRSENFEEYQFQSRINVDEYSDDEDAVNMGIEERPNEVDANEGDEESEHTPFTKIIDENGEEYLIRKSSLVWMLTEPSVSISKNRLRRVQVSNQ